MQYKVLKDGVVLATLTTLKWVRRQKNGVFVTAEEADGQGIVVDDAIYAIRGGPELDGVDAVDVMEVAGEESTGGVEEARVEALEKENEALTAQVNEITGAIERGLE